MNHYCTYFDRGFLIQGLALWRSLAAHDAEAVLWALALDDFTAEVLQELNEQRLRVLTLTELEAADRELVSAKANRTRIEYYFTLSPCWPRWLLATQPQIDRLTYIDADLFFFTSPAPIFSAMDAARASVLITGHRFPAWLRHYEQHGLFNVGILSFQNDAAGRACLDGWRARCLAWCHDRLEENKYADQKYLDDWPSQLGQALVSLEHPGVNLAPWNWATHDCSVLPDRTVRIDGQDLIIFHFARFRPIWGDRWWQSGQLAYGVMPWKLRNAIYGPYWRALKEARMELAARSPGFDFSSHSLRFYRNFWKDLLLKTAFGSNWLRVGEVFLNGRLGLGRYSGHFLARARTTFFRKNRSTLPASQARQRRNEK